MKSLLVLAIALALTACGDDATAPVPLTNSDFAAELNVDLSAMTLTSSGLYLQDLVVGEGAPIAFSETATVHYEGWLPNGTKFDSSRDRGQTFVFQVGARDVIPGWDEGLIGMRIGGLRKLVIPPNLAYGAGGVPPDIPGNATLVFDIELVDITP